MGVGQPDIVATTVEELDYGPARRAACVQEAGAGGAGVSRSRGEMEVLGPLDGRRDPVCIVVLVNLLVL